MQKIQGEWGEKTTGTERGGEVLDKGEATPQGPTPYPFIYHFS